MQAGVQSSLSILALPCILIQPKCNRVQVSFKLLVQLASLQRFDEQQCHTVALADGKIAVAIRVFGGAS